MKHSLRTRFTLGMIFLFLIILTLSIFSGYYLNKLSNKTGAILKENYLSVVYAREMSEGIMNINRELTTGFLAKKISDTSKISMELGIINKSLDLEKHNITEPGEDKLVTGIESDYKEYSDSVINYTGSTDKAKSLQFLQNKAGILFQQLSILSQMNGKALEVKTDDAKAASKNALTRMTILATLCFLVGMSFAFSFTSYFSQRFSQLYRGIKEIGSSNYDQRLFFEGNDEFHEISIIVNEMADKLKENKPKMSVTLPEEKPKGLNNKEIDELKQMIFRIKNLEEQAGILISRIGKKQD
jgi:two-component system, NtrC family, sensor histidine kinase KinB